VSVINSNIYPILHRFGQTDTTVAYIQRCTASSVDRCKNAVYHRQRSSGAVV